MVCITFPMCPMNMPSPNQGDIIKFNIEISMKNMVCNCTPTGVAACLLIKRYRTLSVTKAHTAQYRIWPQAWHSPSGRVWRTPQRRLWRLVSVEWWGWYVVVWASWDPSRHPPSLGLRSLSPAWCPTPPRHFSLQIESFVSDISMGFNMTTPLTVCW